MAVYKDLYSGPDYVIHFKYSGILNIVYITMLYGIGMPILFPVAAFNFLNQWIAERIVVAYFCRLPPALDNKLTNNAIDKLKYAPLLMIFNGYWMISNKQIFTNNIILKDTSEQLTMFSGHLIHDIRVDWAAPMLFMAICSVFLIIIQNLYKDKLQEWGFSLQ